MLHWNQVLTELTEQLLFLSSHFSTESNISYQMSSFNEIVGLGYLKQSAIEFVKCVPSRPFSSRPVQSSPIPLTLLTLPEFEVLAKRIVIITVQYSSE